MAAGKKSEKERKKFLKNCVIIAPSKSVTRAHTRTRGAFVRKKGKNQQKRGRRALVGQHKRFSRKKMLDKWKEYKKYCDSYTITADVFNKKKGVYERQTLNRPITYTIQGFCTFLGISRSAFYETYDCKTGYPDIVTRAREECETDARIKFETGQLSDRLAGLWLSKYGYGGKPDNTANTDDSGVKQFISAMRPTEEQVKRIWDNEEG